MYYLEVFRALNAAGVRYLVAGGVALNLHGVPRMTADLDLFVSLEPSNLRDALDALAALGFVPSVPVPARELLDPGKRKQWREEKNLVAFPFHNPGQPFQAVDVLIDVSIDFDLAWQRRVTLAAEGVDIVVLAVDDLIALKKVAGRPQDIADANALERLRKRRPDG